MKSTITERSQQAKEKIAQKKQKKQARMIEALKKAFANKNHTLPHNNVKQTLKLFNLTFPDLGTVGRKHHIDFMLMDLIDVEGQITDFGETIFSCNSSKQTKLIKEKAMELPKVQILQEFITQCPKASVEAIVEKMPEDFFGQGTLKTRLHQATTAVSWVK